MSVTDKMLSDVSRSRLFKIHLQGTIVRSAASLIMWLFALLVFWVDEIQVSHFIGITSSVLFLVLILPLTLLILKRIARKKVYANFSLFINILEIVGYTGVIYSLGGFEATYLTPIYAALITYLGVIAPQKVPYIVASLCAFAFGSVVALEGMGIIPSLKVDPHFNPSVAAQFIRVIIIIGLLYIVAYISSFTAGKLKHGKEEIKKLRGILPICSFCKKIRNDLGYYEQIEAYIQNHSEVDFSHTICPSCFKKHYPNECEKISADKKK
jgi:hypothetical protein